MTSTFHSYHKVALTLASVLGFYLSRMHPKSKLIDILGSTTHLSESIAEMLVKDLTYSGNLYKTPLIVTEDNIATMWRHQTHYVINCIS